MYNPEQFELMSNSSGESTAVAIGKIRHLIKFKPGNSDTILDVGCGPGNVLVDIILPPFKGKFATCYGTDLSEKMIEFAGKKYENQKNVHFLQMDIMEVDGFLGSFGQVDHVVSSFVFHWVPDLVTGLKNVHKLLKRGGDFATVHPCSTGGFDIYEHMDQNPKWNRFFDNLIKFVPTSHKSEQPEDDLRDQLTKCGFIDVVVELVHRRIIFADNAAFKRYLSSILVQINNIPEELRMEYVEDVFDYGTDQGIFIRLDSGEVYFNLSLFSVFAKRPE